MTSLAGAAGQPIQLKDVSGGGMKVIQATQGAAGLGVAGTRILPKTSLPGMLYHLGDDQPDWAFPNVRCLKSIIGQRF